VVETLMAQGPLEENDSKRLEEVNKKLQNTKLKMT
jgi:hypothetical protein